MIDCADCSWGSKYRAVKLQFLWKNRANEPYLERSRQLQPERRQVTQRLFGKCDYRFNIERITLGVGLDHVGRHQLFAKLSDLAIVGLLIDPLLEQICLFNPIDI